MKFWQTWEIDTIEDVELVEYYLNRNIKPFEFEQLRSSKIELIAFDFDGVLTDNKVLTLQDGSEGIIANRSDGLAIGELKKMNLPMVIISTEENDVVKARARKLQLPVLNGIKDKKIELENYCNEHHIALENTIFIGNDINDLEVMRSVGWPLSPHDANEKVKNISRIILSCNGGDGVIRELWNILKNEGED
ncbi:MAG: HAD hydrolase family protein [Chloroflexi bacterium]|nr:HAD hydrolase family protein [Chloroflexota bacterium]